MGKKDNATKNYMKDNSHFADAFNYFMYDGKKIIDPQTLTELDTAELAIPYLAEGRSSETVAKYRDVLKGATIKRDSKATYLLLGIENQTDVHYAMPVRNMLYDALSYTKQVEEKAREHKKDKDFETNSEFLSGLKKTDKINPVITLVILWSANSWDGPTSLYEMLSTDDEGILKFVSDYRMNLISPYEMDEDKFQLFSTELGDTLHFVKYAKDKERLQNLIASENDYRQLSLAAVRVINEVTNAKIEIKQGEKVIDVCQAILDMKKDSYEDGSYDSKVEDVRKVMLKLQYTPTEAMDFLDIPKENQDKYMKLLMN